MRRHGHCLCTLLHLLIANATVWANFTGLVASVLDGDTIEVLHNTHPERIRLKGIDCPEKGQVYGNNVKPTASELVYGNEVTLQPYGKDKYGRSLVDVLLGDGSNVNHTLVRNGWCWSYLKYAPKGGHTFSTSSP